MLLADWLTAKDMSATEFADLMNVNRSTISRWLSGELRPSWDQIPRIMEITLSQVTANDFVPHTPVADDVNVPSKSSIGPTPLRVA